MSKCYKAEDVIKCVAQYIMTDAKIDNSYVCGDIEDYIELTEAILADLPTIEIEEDCISKRFISDSLIHRITELNKQGEKAIPISTELIRFKEFVDGITPVVPSRAEGEWIEVEYSEQPMCSNCGAFHSGTYTWYYCPNCGAKMKGE